LTESDAYINFFKLAKEIIEQFPVLSQKYDEMCIVLADLDQENEVYSKMWPFLDPSSHVRSQDMCEPPLSPNILAHGNKYKKKCFLWIVLNNFSKMTAGEQSYVIKHEFCHLSLEHSPQEVSEELCLKFPDRPYSILQTTILFRDYMDFEADRCVLERFPDYRRTDLFRGLVSSAISSDAVRHPEGYRALKKTLGKPERFLRGITLSIHALMLINLCNHIIQNFSLDDNTFFENGALHLRRFVKSVRKQMKKDYPIKIQTWVNQDVFRKKDVFLARIMELLKQINYDKNQDRLRS